MRNTTLTIISYLIVLGAVYYFFLNMYLAFFVKEIIEYEISNLYLKGIADGKIVKNIKLELAW